MTNDEITRMANKIWMAGEVYIGPRIDNLARFAALVASAEREAALRDALAEHSGDATEMVTAEPDNLLRKGLAQALRGIANGFDQRRPWSRPDPLIMRTLRRAADELDKEDA